MAYVHSKRPGGLTLWLLVGAIGLATMLWLVIVVLPAVFAPGIAFSTRPEAIKTQNEVRTTLLQGTGALLILASAVAGAYFTWRQVRNSTQTLHYTQEQLELARAGQVTERFTRAVDQLGSGTLEIRLGGIYALDRIARDSEQDCPTIIDILAAYVRTHAPWPPSRQDQVVKDAPLDDLAELRVRSPDIQAILTILGRLHSGANGSLEIDLSSADLRRAKLVKASLPKADLSRKYNMDRLRLGRSIRR